jgi:hypothetical protein
MNEPKNMKSGRIHDPAIDRVGHLDRPDQRVPEFARTGEINAIRRDLYDLADRSFYRQSKPINNKEVSRFFLRSEKDRSMQALSDQSRSDKSCNPVPSIPMDRYTPESDQYRIGGVAGVRAIARSVDRLNKLAIAIASHHGQQPPTCGLNLRDAHGARAPIDPSARLPGSAGGRNRARAHVRAREAIDRMDRRAELLHSLKCELEQLKNLSARSNRARKQYRSQIHAIERRITEIG